MNKRYVIMEVDLYDDTKEIVGALQRFLHNHYGGSAARVAEVHDASEFRTAAKEALNSAGAVDVLRTYAPMLGIHYSTQGESYYLKEGEGPTPEFIGKRIKLALSLFNLAYDRDFKTLDEVTEDPAYGAEYASNYLADADDILRTNSHLLDLGTVELMGLDKKDGQL